MAEPNINKRVLMKIPEMKLTEQQEKLLEFVKKQHGYQRRKYNGEPYWHHLVSVAEIASQHVEGAIEIALSHDLLEDTDCTYEELFKFLENNGFNKNEARNISNVTKELTDVYVKEDYPNLNRKKRKRKEAQRLGKISALGQSIKYADLIDNTVSIVEHDKQFARVYLKEAVDLLDQMRDGNIHLLIKCCHTIQNSLNKLKS